MVEIVKFMKEHAGMIEEQDAEKWLSCYITDQHLTALENSPFAFTAIKEGKVLGCAGVSELWPGRAQAWAILAKGCRHEFFHIHQAVTRFLASSPFRRIEAHVDCNFKAGHRWMRLLGFKVEAERMKAFFPGGRDAALYSFIREEGECL